MKIYLLKRKGQLSKESEQQGKVRKTSLYLMYHFGPGQKREYEFLNLYLFEKPKSLIEKDHNKQTLQLAETIKAKRILDAQSTAHGFISKVKSRICFITFFKKLVEKKYTSTGNYGNWKSVYEHLVKFTGGKELPLERVDERFLEGFKDYLVDCATIKGKGRVQKLNRNTASSYFNKVRTALKEAYNQRMIKENPATRVKCLKGQETHREFLTIEELQKLAQTPCDHPQLKQLFLASAMTGLRFSDLKKMRWAELKYSEQHGHYIQYTQQKTKKAEILPIADHVIDLMGEHKESDELVFPGVVYSQWNNHKLQQWINSAGIYKKITLHCARHTYACLQISLGTNIAVISRLLGHSNIKTTQIYTKILDSDKIKAASNMPRLC